MKKTLFVVLLYTLHLTLSTGLYPAFNDTGWGARAGGMGNCFTAIANDSTALFWNPAGIAQVKLIETTFLYNRLFAGIEDVNLAQMSGSLVYPTGSSAFGFAVTNFSLAGCYKESMAIAGYSYNFIESLGLDFPLMVGFNLKYLTHSYMLDNRTKATNDPVFADNTSAGGFTPELGILLKPWKIAIGVSALNILQPDLGLKTEDKVPMVVKAGVAYPFSARGFLEKITPTAEVSYRKPADTVADTKITGGVELWMKGGLGLRFGGNDREITAGFSYNRTFVENGIQIDYSFLSPIQLTNVSGSHRISITFRMAVPQKRSAVAKKAMVFPVDAPAKPMAKPREKQNDFSKEKLSKEGYQHFDKGEYQDAINDWEKVLEINPNDVEIQSKIKLARMWLGQNVPPPTSVTPYGEDIKKEQLNINTANEIELIDVGFTREQARNIVSYRKKTKFKDISELMNVPGITPEKYEELKSSLKVK